MPGSKALMVRIRSIHICVFVAIALGSALAAEPAPAGRDLMQRAMQQSSDNNCQRCHKLDPLTSHPVGVTPSMEVPAHLPLEQGRMTCVTCHDTAKVHSAGARSEPVSTLRDPQIGEAFCTQCHISTERSSQSQHPLALGRAHLAMRSAPSGSPVSLGRFDDETNLCLSCHDGLMARDAGTSPPQFDGLPGNHSIGVSMRQSRGSSSDEALRAPALLDRRIRLFEDRVGCGSCHSPYSSEKKLLVMSNRGSQLCLSCHTP